jgi:Autotransporter beta-domain
MTANPKPSKAGLLARASTIAIVAATGALATAPQAQADCTGQLVITAATIIATNQNCAVVNGSVSGDITINSGVEVGPGDQDIAFLFGGEGSYSGTLRNHGTISDYIALQVSTDTFSGNIVNTGTGIINGTAYGVLIQSDAVFGDFTNNGKIQGDVGVSMVNDDIYFGGKMEGVITNTGTISGDITGLEISNFTLDRSGISAGDDSAAIRNSGTIEGGNTGLLITQSDVFADIINEESGIITGGSTGAYIGTNDFFGLIQNDGLIEGFDSDTGLHIVTADDHVGDIVNNGTLRAVSNALHVDIANFNGAIINNGTIRSTGDYYYGPQTAVQLNIVNGANFTNDGQIIGDVYMNGAAATYNFIGTGGGLQGDLTGQGTGLVALFNDDTVTVQNGTHYFIDGTATNLESFTVGEGGIAVMGAENIGSLDHRGYAFNNVDLLNLNTGGTLYIDSATILNVGPVVEGSSYNQQSGSTLMFFLGAPDDYENEVDFSDRTGVIHAEAGVDYGRIIVDGVAHLNGTLAGYLDPEFQNANPGLTEVIYDNVIEAGDIEGDFTDVELFANSAIWQLTHTVQGGVNDPYAVDLRLTRTSLSHIGGLSNIVVETAGPWKSMVNDRSNGIGSGSCGLAGDGWCLNRFAANEPGATQVMTDATPGDDPFNWLRTGVRKVGETAAWGRVVGVWGETDGSATVGGTDFRVGGVIVGVDHVFTQDLLAGVAAQWTTSDVDFDGRPDNAEIDSFEIGAYASYGDARLYVNANTSFIWHDFEVNRFVGGNTAVGDYDGTTFSAYAEVGKIFETYDGLRIQPLAAVSIAHLETSAYSETGTALTKLDVYESEFESLKSNIGARFAYPIQMESGRKWVPEARIVWAHEFLDDQSSFLADAQGGPVVPQRVFGEKISRDTLVLGTGVTVPLSADATAFVDYDAGLNADVTSHTLSVGLRMKW